MALSSGYTLMHEHMSLGLSPGDMGTESFDLLCADLMDAYRYGEIAWSYPGPREKELKSWEGMCIAARRTGATVSTHPSHGEQQIPQAEYLLLHGIAPERIVIGHIEFYLSDPSLKKLLGMGLYLGLDMIGKKSGWGDEYRADTVRKIKRWGCLDQLLLSMDLCRKDDLRSAGGYGYAYLFESFIPMLEKRGITGDEIDRMLRKNPEKALASVPSRADA